MLHDPSVWQFKLQCPNSTCPAGETPPRADRWKVIRKVMKAGIRKRRAGLKRWLEIQHAENRYKRVALKLADWLQEESPGKVNVVRNDAKYKLAVNLLDDEFAVSIRMLPGKHQIDTELITAPFRFSFLCLLIGM